MYKQEIIKQIRNFNPLYKDTKIEFIDEDINEFFKRVNDKLNIIGDNLVSINYVNDKKNMYAVIVYKEDENEI